MPCLHFGGAGRMLKVIRSRFEINIWELSLLAGHRIKGNTFQPAWHLCRNMREYEHMNTLIIILLRITNVVVHIYDSTAAAHNILIQLLECAIPPPTRMPISQKRKGFFFQILNLMAIPEICWWQNLRIFKTFLDFWERKRWFWSGWQ